MKTNWKEELLKILNDKSQSIVLDLRLYDFISSLLDKQRAEIIRELDKKYNSLCEEKISLAYQDGLAEGIRDGYNNFQKLKKELINKLK